MKTTIVESQAPQSAQQELERFLESAVYGQQVKEAILSGMPETIIFGMNLILTDQRLATDPHREVIQNYAMEAISLAHQQERCSPGKPANDLLAHFSQEHFALLNSLAQRI